MAHYRNTQNFTPRQDIVMENKVVPMGMEKSTTTAIPFGKNTNIHRKLNLLSLTRQKFQPVLAIVLIWLIIPALKKHKKYSSERFTTNFSENHNTPETIVNMLSDITPYLDLQDQENIQTLIGIFEAINILNNIRAGTYQSPRILKNISLSANPQDRKLGIIKAIKTYLPSNNHEVIDKAIHTYNTIDKVSQSLANYTSKTSDNVQTQNNINKITEMFEIIAPIVPDKQRKMLNQIQKMIKMYTAMESSSQLWEEWTQDEQKQVKKQDASNDNDPNNDNTEKSASNPKKQEKNITDALKSVLKPEQSQAMEVMMKMAQLLSQESTNNKGSHKKNEND